MVHTHIRNRALIKLIEWSFIWPRINGNNSNHAHQCRTDKVDMMLFFFTQLIHRLLCLNIKWLKCFHLALIFLPLHLDLYSFTSLFNTQFFLCSSLNDHGHHYYCYYSDIFFFVVAIFFIQFISLIYLFHRI